MTKKHDTIACVEGFDTYFGAVVIQTAARGYALFHPNLSAHGPKVATV
jgi:hypothetical protein